MVGQSLKCRIQGLLPWLRNTFFASFLTLFALFIINIVLLLPVFQHILASVPMGIHQWIWTSESREQMRWSKLFKSKLIWARVLLQWSFIRPATWLCWASYSHVKWGINTCPRLPTGLLWTSNNNRCTTETVKIQIQLTYARHSQLYFHLTLITALRGR